MTAYLPLPDTDVVLELDAPDASLASAAVQRALQHDGVLRVELPDGRWLVTKLAGLGPLTVSDKSIGGTIIRFPTTLLS